MYFILLYEATEEWRVGKLEELKEAESSDCYFIGPFSGSILPTPGPAYTSPLSLSPPWFLLQFI